MTAFPALIPSSRVFTPGDRAHALLRSIGGRSTQVRHSNVVTGQQLQLAFNLLTEANMLAVQLHYINRRGQFSTFSLPSAIWSGTTDRTISGYSWRYISMPRVEEPFCGRFDVSLTLEMVAEYAPPATTGDAFVQIPRAAVTVATLLPVVSGNAAVTVAIPAADVTVEGAAPAVQGAAIVQIPAAAVTVAGLVPTVEDATSITVVIPSADVTVESLVFAVQGAAVVEIPAATATVAALVPLIDADAIAFVAAVESADGQAIEADIAIAYQEFFVGCKADGIWAAIKAACILAGARTLSGALTPLVGTAPTNNNFVSGDYNRKTGLVGDGSTKYLNSNRNNNADPQNSKHVCVFATTATTGGNWMNSGPGGTVGRTGIAFSLAAPNQSTAQTSLNSLAPFGAAGEIASASANNKLAGLSRSSGASFIARFNGASTTVSLASTTPNNGNITLYARPASPVDLYSTTRLAFYSIGESLNLALLDARVTALINAIAAAIP